jgi:hypothetical protein
MAAIMEPNPCSKSEAILVTMIWPVILREA